MVSHPLWSLSNVLSYLRDHEMYLISETPEIISKYARVHTKLPKNKTPGTLDFNDVVKISNAVIPITLWKREIKSSQQR